MAQSAIVTCPGCGLSIAGEHRTTIIDLLIEARNNAGQRSPLAPVSHHPAPHLAPCGLPCGAGGSKHPDARSFFRGLVDGLTGRQQWHHISSCARCGRDHVNYPKDVQP